MTMRRFFISILPITLAFVILIFGFQNCDWNDPFSTNNEPPENQTSNSQSSFKATLPVSKGVLDTDCRNSNNYNACIFWKNPVAQNAMAFTPATTFSTDLSGLQIYGVNIAGMTDGYLKNNTYNVLVNWSNAQRATFNEEQNWKFSYANDLHHRVAQVMTYYWLIYQMSFMQKKTGKWYAENKDIQVIALDEDAQNDAYFSPQDNKIVLGHFNKDFYGPNGQIEVGLSGDIILHEAAHASFYHSSPQRLGSLKNSHKNCSTTTCCMGYEGCLKAINEGQADFHSMIIYESSPSIGEGVTNNLERGLGICMNRHPEDVKRKTAIEVYNGCGLGHELSGEIHIMGTFYASIWWVIYQSNQVNKNEIIRLFVEHLPLTSNDDTFETIGRKIKGLDSTMFNGKYSDLIHNTFADRGLYL